MTAQERETDVKVRQKVAYLQRLLTLRLRFMKYATGVDVTHDGQTVFVKWNMKREGQPTQPDVIDYEMIEFPITHLSKRIRHYLLKFRAEYSNRHKPVNNFPEKPA